MKYQTLFSLKNKKRYFKISSAAVEICAKRVSLQGLFYGVKIFNFIYRRLFILDGLAEKIDRKSK